MPTSFLTRRAAFGLYLAAATMLSAAQPSTLMGEPRSGRDRSSSLTTLQRRAASDVRLATARSAGTRQVAQAPAGAVGRGGLERATCVVCAGLILAAGGASLGGLFVLAGAFPESIIGCGAVCVLAFG